MTERPLTSAEFRLLAAAGAAAPSLHNSQPWWFRPSADRCGLLVYGDPARAVSATDPDRRARYVSVGAAVFNLRTAAGHLGRDAAVALCPDPEVPALLAGLDFSRPGGPGRPDLYGAIGHRHSSRLPFTDRRVPPALVRQLVDAARAEAARLAVPEEDEVRRVLELTLEAERRSAADPVRQAESRSWLRFDGPAADGIPTEALGPPDRDARLPMRDFTGGSPTAAGRPFEAVPQLAVLSTRTDRPTDWLRAGQALERVWLLATVHGLRATMLNQALEWSDTRWRLLDPADGPGHVQAVLRIGYGPPGAPTPRRAVDEVLDTGGHPGGNAGGHPGGRPAGHE